MKIVSNYQEIVTEYDYHCISYQSKKDIIYMIKKFLRRKNNEKLSYTDLKDKNRRQLFYIWMKNKPKNLFKQFKII